MEQEGIAAAAAASAPPAGAGSAGGAPADAAPAAAGTAAPAVATPQPHEQPAAAVAGAAAAAGGGAAEEQQLSQLVQQIAADMAGPDTDGLGGMLTDAGGAPGDMALPDSPHLLLSFPEWPELADLPLEQRQQGQCGPSGAQAEAAAQHRQPQQLQPHEHQALAAMLLGAEEQVEAPAAKRQRSGEPEARQ